MRIPRSVLLALAGLAGVVLSTPVARADVRLASIFCDHMVLQRQSRALLWGTAAPGELIRVRPSWYENDAAVTAGPDGKFELSIATPAEAGPHTIRFRGHNEVWLRDVLLGEVWLASGQSNMEMGVGFQHAGYSGVRDWERELEDADRPRIRLFTVQNAAAAGPLADVHGTWRAANAASVKDFSATAWFFAKGLERDLGVPVGVIASDWGGTPAEAWTSAGALGGFPQYTAALAECARLSTDPAGVQAVHERARGVWGREVAKVDPLSAAHAEAPGFDDSAWVEIANPGAWGGDLAGFDGLVWMRRTVEIPASWAGRELLLELGAIDDDERTWFGGELLGATEGWTVPRSYRVSAERVKAGPATIAVRVLDTGGDGGLRGESSQMKLGPVGGKESISLAGAWRAARGTSLAQLPPKAPAFEVGPGTPSALFNGMIAPLERLSLAGFLWYQGESNVRRAEEYRTLFPTMIRDWRGRFGAELPFLYVQIAPFGYGEDRGEAGDLRAAQALALELPRTGMVVTLDIGDAVDIHPKEKQAVGERLGALALELAYGKPPVRPPAPVPLAAVRGAAPGSVELEFSGPVRGLGASAFELAGADGRFHPARSEPVSPATPGPRVLVTCPEVPEPVRLRYAWAAAASPSMIGTQSPLPIAPFEVTVR
ncbi:MAG: 9-O-acetylesterase [Planctomycetes bacterium]|nr:9-O-acetylesterase [Planctomycetota bacterium]